MASAGAATANGLDGGHKRAAAPSSDSGGGDGKRQRLGSEQCAAAASGSSDPLDRIPDAPMHLMRVRGIPDWANEGFLGVSLGDLVRGKMKWVLISNYMLDMRWLLSSCPDLMGAERLVVVHGESGDVRARIYQDLVAAGLGDRSCVHKPHLPIEFGVHHSKAFLIQYDRGLRLIIFTANAIYADCNSKSQGVYWQDFPPKDERSPRSSPMQAELERYLNQLRLRGPDMAQTIRIVAAHDFSAARAHLVASVPDRHRGGAIELWGHRRLRRLLHAEPPFPAAFRGAPLVSQYSSLGGLDQKWLQNEFRVSLSQGTCDTGGGEALGMPPALKLVWPTASEIQNSIEGWFAGRSCPGPKRNVERPFLQPLYCRWGGEVCGRQRAMPHIKTCLRHSGQDVAWMYVGSHNLSKAAWGEGQLNGTQLQIRSYELGVLLVPSLEAAYRASRWRGFSCTSAAPWPPPAATTAGALQQQEETQQQQQQQQEGQQQGEAQGGGGGGAEVIDLCSSDEEGAQPARPQQGAAQAAAAAPAAGAAAPPVVRFVAWQRGMQQGASQGPGGELVVPLPIPYNLPPASYGGEDQAWMCGQDSPFPGVDSLGYPWPGNGAHYGWLDNGEWAG